MMDLDIGETVIRMLDDRAGVVSAIAMEDPSATPLYLVEWEGGEQTWERLGDIVLA